MYYFNGSGILFGAVTVDISESKKNGHHYFCNTLALDETNEGLQIG